MERRGYFGQFGGMYIPEVIRPALEELEDAYVSATGDASFQNTLDGYLKNYAGRPSPLTFAERLTVAPD